MQLLLRVWQGIGEGKAGIWRVARTYLFVLNNKVIYAQSKSISDTEENNPGGEVHKERDFISHDRAGETYVFRQFHLESFLKSLCAQ